MKKGLKSPCLFGLKYSRNYMAIEKWRVGLAPRSSHSQRQVTFPDNVCSYSPPCHHWKMKGWTRCSLLTRNAAMLCVSCCVSHVLASSFACRLLQPSPVRKWVLFGLLAPPLLCFIILSVLAARALLYLIKSRISLSVFNLFACLFCFVLFVFV